MQLKPPPKFAAPPSYRCRTGTNKAIVTLTDSASGKRKDFWLGDYGSTASREKYHRVLLEWELAGGRWPATNRSAPTERTVVIKDIIESYWAWSQTQKSAGELGAQKSALRVLRQYFGGSPADAFGPKALRLVRESMIKGEAKGKHPRQPWSRKTVNQQVQRIIALFRWAAGQELVPASVHQQLRMIEPLKRGKTSARERLPVRPVDDAVVGAIRPFVSRQVWALIQLQRLTGARGGEILKLRKSDLQRPTPHGAEGGEEGGREVAEGRVWTFTPADHKNAHREQTRTIFFGPRARAVLEPFMVGRADHAYLFSPREAEAERRAAQHAARKTPRGYGNGPGTNRVENPDWSAGDHYTPATYRRAIERGCQKAFPPPAHLKRRRVASEKGGTATRYETTEEWKARLGDEQWTEWQAWHRKHRWHPHQLRHSAATAIRKQFGLEAAQLALGHSSALVTEAVYAERDQSKVVEIMARCG